ncbi:Dynamin family protein [Chitinispirillum alkaliphilum]|nr:Dynamin family protein [Chitinispirillum alkaliphilum]
MQNKHSNTPDSISQPVSFDEIVDKALHFCRELPHACSDYCNQISDLKYRLTGGKLHLAVLGQFNRGKSTFINALLGLKVLPTSILPVTSVPTRIEYGEEHTCTISFLNGKPDLSIRNDREKISAALIEYVAEENNPKNQLCVRDVKLTCNSSLLANGTVLIDTPGFGSTHVHNTSTTVDFLSGCDAAIFILSADPPFTQTEVEFLKQVKLYIPKLFFVLNKIDILSKDQKIQVDRFIKNILKEKLQHSGNVKLFHISAVMGEEAQKHSPKDKHWKSSGLEEIKAEVLDFMVREKYFTLSEALGDKFKASLSGIEHIIREEIVKLKSPIDHSAKEQQKITSLLEDLAKHKDYQLKKLDAGVEELIQRIEKQITTSAENIRSDIDQIMDEKLIEIHNFNKSASNLAIFIPSALRNSFDKLQFETMSLTDKSFRFFVSAQESELQLFISSIWKFPPKPLNEPFVDQEITPPLYQDFFTVSNFPLPQKPPFLILVSAHKQAKIIKEYFKTPIGKQINFLKTRVINDSTASLNKSAEILRNTVISRYDLTKQLLEDMLQKETDKLNSSAKENSKLQDLESQLRCVEEIRSLLVN